MKRRINKTEKKVLGGLIKKGIAFVGTLSPEEVELLSKMVLGTIKIEVDDEEE